MRWRDYAAAGGTVVVLIASLRGLSIEAAGVAAPLLLLNVVVVARFWGVGPALFTAALNAAAYSYYFLPPAGFGIEDPDDWIALVTFIVTAAVAGELASRAERRAAEARAGRLEIERLYQELQVAFDRASEAEAERRNERLKAGLLDALTHNLRTPLTATKAAVTALLSSEKQHDAPLSRAERQELLQVIDEESDRLNRFIEGLAKTDGDEPALSIHVRLVKIEDVVRAALARAESLTRDYRVTVALDDGLPDIWGDAASIVEAIYILLDNASKYAPPGTRIGVQAGRYDERHVEIAVADEGPGIPEGLRDRVFERFFRVPGRESHDPRRGGVGLGLAIARRLVEAQAGKVWVEAAPAGRGTVVRLTLPSAEDSPEIEESPLVSNSGVAHASGS